MSCNGPKLYVASVTCDCALASADLIGRGCIYFFNFHDPIPSEYQLLPSFTPMSSKRVCQIIKLKPEHVDEYIKIHSEVWPGVLAALERAHIIDYSIHHHAPLQLLIANFKYIGEDYDADMKKVAEDPETQRWWKVTDGMQESFEEGAEGSGKEVPWWTTLPEVFRFEGKA